MLKKRGLHRQTTVIMAYVLIMHVFIFWLMLEYYQPFRLPKAQQSKAMRIHLVSVSASTMQTRDQAVAAATVQVKQSMIKQSVQPEPVVTIAKQQILHSSQSTQKIAVQSAAPKSNQSIQPTRPVTTAATVTTAISAKSSNHSTNHGEATASALSSQYDTSTAIAQDPHDSSPQPSQNNQEPQRLQVSQVEMLKMGAIQYNDRHLQGENRLILLTIDIDPQGQPIQIRIKRSSGLDYLDQMVIKAAQKARFRPHLINGQAVAIVVDYPFQLNLSRR